MYIIQIVVHAAEIYSSFL